VRWLAEIVKMTTHVHLLARLTIADGHVDGATLGVSRLTGNILGKETLFLLRRVVVCLVTLVGSF
jgi:hypothetical protein